MFFEGFFFPILYFTDITRIVYSASRLLPHTPDTTHTRARTHTHTHTPHAHEPMLGEGSGRAHCPPPPPPQGGDRMGDKGTSEQTLAQPSPCPAPLPCVLTSYSDHNLVYYAVILVSADAPT